MAARPPVGRARLGPHLDLEAAVRLAQENERAFLAEIRRGARLHDARRSKKVTLPTARRTERPRERRDSGSRRASGARSGQDPGGDDPPPSRPALVVYERHPRYGLATRPLLRLLEAVGE
jgi:hypothetical protein